MRIAIIIVLLICATIGADAQRIKLLTFVGDSSVVLRWIGNTNPKVDGWYLERSVDNGPWTRLTPQPLTREMSSSRATARVGKYRSGFYRMLFGVDSERDLTQADVVRTLTSDKVGFHFALLAANPDLSELTGERFIDSAIPLGIRTVRYRVLMIVGDGTSIASESPVIEPSKTDRVPVPDTIIVEEPENAVRLRWPRIAQESERGDVVSYRIWKGASQSGPFEEATTLAMLTLFNNAEDEKWYTWTDEFIESGTSAYYYVRQVHGAGVLGD
ncbi:MAG: hypothetical protein H7X70_04490, partial [Candidatus Kapabacteria bacterium]|nr:hypothetical protein [Candidatus Kapabacteria bacterium]